MRPVLKAELEKAGPLGKDSNTSIVMTASERWKAMSDDDKKEYNDLHLKEKELYDEKMKNYQPPVDAENECD